MSDVVNTVTTKYVVDNRDAIAQTQRLADAQTKHAKEAARAMDLFQREATAALGKVEKSVAAQEKAWIKAQKAMEEGGGVFGRAFDKAKGAAEGFNRVVGLVNATVGNVKNAIDLGTTAVNLLGKAWSSVANELNKPQLRMQWEKSSQDDWFAFMKKAQEEQAKFIEGQVAIYLGADVDSPKNRARRAAASAEAKRQRDADAEYRAIRAASGLPDEAGLAQATPGLYAPFYPQALTPVPTRAGRGGGTRRGGGPTGRTAEDDFRLMIAASEAMRRLEAFVAKNATPDYSALSSLFLGGEDTSGVLGLLGQGADLVSGFAGPRYAAESIGMGRRTGGQGFNALNADQGPGLLERVFGPREDFDFYATALGTLRDATTEVYTALVTGSESAGAALKRVVGTAIMAEGSRMAVEALKEGAYAIAALAQGNLPSAALHGKAAAGFLAGSVAAGVAASALGAGGGSTSAGASSAGPSTIGPGGSSVFGAGMDRDARTTIVLGNGWEDESPRERSQRIARAMERAGQYRRPTEGVTWE